MANTTYISSQGRRHVRQLSCGKPDCVSCVICDCFVCEVCGLYEGCLTSECPGVESYWEHGDTVYRGDEDFINGQWMAGMISPHSPASWDNTV